MGWLEDFIESLPSEYEDLARVYLPAIKRMPKDEVLEWIDYLRKNNEAQAHAMLVKKMTTDEIIADGDKGNELLKALNKERAEKVNMGWHILYMIVSIALERLED